MAFTWNPKTRRFSEDGKVIAPERVREALDAVIETSKVRVGNLTEALRAGTANYSEWYLGMVDEIKMVHLAAASAANGGIAQMTQSQLGKVGAELRNQYEYLRGFLDEMEAGDVPLDGRTVSRATLYVDSGSGTYEATRGVLERSAGMDQERSILSSRAQHCGQCLSEAGKNWQAIGSLIPIGHRTCLGRCKCRMDYRRESESVVELRRAI